MYLDPQGTLLGKLLESKPLLKLVPFTAGCLIFFLLAIFAAAAAARRSRTGGCAGVSSVRGLFEDIPILNLDKNLALGKSNNGYYFQDPDEGT